MGNCVTVNANESIHYVGGRHLREFSSSSGRNSSDFRILRRIGEGATSQVFLAESKNNSGFVALKQIRKKEVGELSMVEVAHREARVLSAVSSPYVVPMVDFFQDEKTLVFVLQYAEFGDLRGYLCRSRRLPEKECALFAAKVLVGLEALHKKGFVHCDLKPENILINEKGMPMLSDLGHSQVAGKLKPQCGTAEYVAPEVLEGRVENGPAFGIDFWAFGVVLYEMLVGISPFYTPQSFSTFRRILNDPVKESSYLGETAFNLISGLLEKEPELRLGSGESGASEIRAHPFFKDIVWSDIEAARDGPLASFFRKSSEELDEGRRSFECGIDSTFEESFQQSTLLQGFSMD